MNKRKTVYLPTFFVDEDGRIIEKKERKNHSKKKEYYERRQETRYGIEYDIYQRYVILEEIRERQLELEF